MNTLYYGDNLDILRRYVKDESVDLVYLDPPFNSAQDYNVLFAEQDGRRSAAQIQAFEDTWEWSTEASRSFYDVVEKGGKLSQALQGLRLVLGDSDMLAYLAMIAPRLEELHRVLKPTGSMYLHCDPTASHFLKLIMDAIFDPRNYRSEIIWKRSSAHSDSKQGRKNYGHIHDVVLFYSKSKDLVWQTQYTPYSQEYIDDFYRHVEPETGRRYQLDNLTASRPGGDTEYEWKGIRPYKGRYWAYSKANMEKFEAAGRLVYGKSGMPRYKRYLDEMPGVPLQDVWTDIRPIGSKAAERLGYPTQKPESLLERIILTSSHEGDVVLDPFCGCGTSIAAAQRLNRQWLGIDVTHLAIGLIKARLTDTYGVDIAKTYKVIGEPTSLPDAIALAAQDKYQFQYWALGLVGARPAEQKKGADRGIDGRLYFHDGDAKGQTKQVIFSVKGGHTDVTHVRDLVGVLDREKAHIGVLISLQDPTGPMKVEAASAGFYASPWGGTFPRVQLLTIADLLNGKRVEMPNATGMNQTFKQAPKAKQEAIVTQPSLLNVPVPVPDDDTQDEDDPDAWDAPPNDED